MRKCNWALRSVRNKSCLWFLAVLLTGVTASLGPREARSQETVYVTNRFSNNVSAIDPTTNTVIGSPIAVGVLPFDVTASPDGSRVYVVNNSIGALSVSVIETATNTVTETIGVGFQAKQMVFSPDGTRGYVLVGGHRLTRGSTSG